MTIPTVLIHYTSSHTRLLSIVKFGFLFNTNSTGLLDSIVGGRTIPEDSIQGPGMVCFSEPQKQGPNRLRDTFGRFGVAIDARKLERWDCRQVCYFSPDGPLGARLRRILDQYAPPQRPILSAPQAPTKSLNFNDEAEFEHQVQSALIASGRELSGFNVHRGWLKILDRLRYCETLEHAWEKEWRVPHPSVMMRTSLEAKSIGERNFSLRKMDLNMLEAIYKRSAANGRVSAEDRRSIHMFSLPFDPPNILWLEVPIAKCASVKRKLSTMTSLFGLACGSIEVRPI